MKCFLPYVAIATGGLGFISWFLTFFYLPSCYFAMAFFILSEILFIICVVKGGCSCFKQKPEEV